MRTRRLPALLLSSLALASCAPPPPELLDPPPLSGSRVALEEVARSPQYQWTGLAVSHEGRVFVCFPRWPGPHSLALAQLRDGQLRAFPDAVWNAWTPDAPTPAPADAFVCPQSVLVDTLNRLWVLDAASPNLAGPVPGGPKLVQIDLATDRVARVYRIDPYLLRKGSYLNDVRIDTRAARAYITDSGVGCIIALDLATGAARRFLAQSPCTKADTLDPFVAGKGLRLPDHSVPRIHADGLALDTVNGYLYFQPLICRTLYRIPLGALADLDAPDEDVDAAVECLGQSVMTDGMECDPAGNVYLSAIELGAIVVRRPDGFFASIVRTERLSWPDSFAFTGAGDLLVSCSQVHLSPLITGGAPPRSPYTILRVPASALPR